MPLKISARAMAALLPVALLGACASGGGAGPSEPYRTSDLRPYSVHGRVYDPRVYKRYDQEGLASWYSYPAHTRRTADGEWFDGRDMTAAHKTLPLPCMVEVTNLANGRSVELRVNDRGPFVKGRIIDVSRAAADRLGFTAQGTARVRVRFLGPAPYAETTEMQAVIGKQTADG